MIQQASWVLLLGAVAYGQAPPTRPSSRSTRRMPRCALTPMTMRSLSFQQGITVAPERAAIRKDLGYAYIKVGETEQAREQFRAAMEIDPADTQVAMEFAFLAYRDQAAGRSSPRVRPHSQTRADPPPSLPNRRFRISTALWPLASSGGKTPSPWVATTSARISSWRHWPSSATSWHWRRALR